MAIFCSPRQRDNVSIWQKDPEGRLLSLLISGNGTRVNLVNFYAPTNPTERGAFLQSLRPYFLPNSQLVLAGDFNCYDGILDKMGARFLSMPGALNILKAANLPGIILIFLSQAD